MTAHEALAEAVVEVVGRKVAYSISERCEERAALATDDGEAQVWFDARWPLVEAAGA